VPGYVALTRNRIVPNSILYCHVSRQRTIIFNIKGFQEIKFSFTSRLRSSSRNNLFFANIKFSHVGKGYMLGRSRIRSGSLIFFNFTIQSKIEISRN